MSRVFQVSAHGKGDVQGNYWVNVWNYFVEGDDTTSPLEVAQDLAAQWQSAVLDSYRALIPSDVTILALKVRCVSAGGGPSVIVALSMPGASADQAQTTGTSPNVAWYPTTTPWKIGHTYLPAVDVVSFINGAFVGSYIILVTTWINDMLAPIVGLPGGNTATFALLDKETMVSNIVFTGLLRPKITLMNRRTLPNVF